MFYLWIRVEEKGDFEMVEFEFKSERDLVIAYCERSGIEWCYADGGNDNDNNTH